MIIEIEKFDLKNFSVVLFIIFCRKTTYYPNTISNNVNIELLDARL